MGRLPIHGDYLSESATTPRKVWTCHCRTGRCGYISRTHSARGSHIKTSILLTVACNSIFNTPNLFFERELGYEYLGDWHHRQDNSNIEKVQLTDWLKRQRHSDQIIPRVLFELNKAATLAGNQTLYGANREVYNLMRYGVKVQPSASEQHTTVWRIADN